MIAVLGVAQGLFGMGRAYASTWLGQITILAVAGLAALWAFGAHEQHIGATQAAAEIDHQSEVLSARATESRATAEKSSDPLADLVHGYCRDC